ncbi:phosphoenolpyruvate hydrolase family protein [Mycolicibacter arupensis]|jgi:predicted TIM-barrel enzyme|uniref:Phosphoenolpyruvate hydrolase family protein n=1 Tax=Mycolicibacter arupensis TaxID=342002 RepID=A0A5C7XJ14_9MYCO|nr:phosphoenolpyruvate hydrolase family protein [Mycolicibacter arupensis]TXI49386.1 MAG: phosphoenolpyruvate hydrolase family protein [Mycolicibacter arupensis]
MSRSAAEIIASFRQQNSDGKQLVGAGAGTGLSARSAHAGGADFLVVYNSGRYRMAGRGSLAGLLAYGDANAIVLDMAGEIIPVAAGLPVFAGVNGTDPFRRMPAFLDEVKAAGYLGVQNFPTVGVFDGTFRANLEATGMGYDVEVAMMRAAAERDLVTAPYVFTVDEAEAMITDGGADIVVAHMGLTTSGSVGADVAVALQDAARACQQIVDAARRLNPAVLVLAHGGPIATSADWRYVKERTEGLNGFLGASSMERLPVEQGIADAVAGFKAI